METQAITMTSAPSSALYWTCVGTLDTQKPCLIFLQAAWMPSSMFDETTKHLSSHLPNANLLCIGANGHCKTYGGRKTFTLWDQADDIVALMDQLEIRKATFVGISMGSLIATRLALAYPTRVDGLCLLSSTATAESPEAAAAVAQVRDIWVSTDAPSESIMDIAIQGWGGEADLAGPRATQIKRHWVSRHSGAENIDAILASVVGRDNILGRLKEITVPVLLVHGELDATWKVQEAEAIRDALVNARVKLEVLKGVGHMVIWLRESRDVSDLIAGFVKEHVTSETA